MKHTIFPYLSLCGNQKVWVFDDPATGLKNEGLVSGTDQILEFYSKGCVCLQVEFSDQPFDGWRQIFYWQGEGMGKGSAEGHPGNWYQDEESKIHGWLCPALFKYFEKPPQRLYTNIVPLPNKLPPNNVVDFQVQ